ncbi:MAG: hypothetical protein GSR80_000105 [Desulfurococcales archaeon]|nr:hypothetical protein [Desulfurococcales archaeon]
MDAAVQLALRAARLEVCLPLGRRLSIHGERYFYYRNPRSGRLEACVAWNLDGETVLCCESAEARAYALRALGVSNALRHR